jgi:DNA-binding FrmR family transcriptional regulator
MATSFSGSGSQYTNEQNAFYTRVTRYFDNRFETLSTQVQSDRTEIMERLDKTDGRLDNIEKRLDAIEKDVANIAAFQQTLMDAFKAAITDVTKQIADSHATLMGEINKLKQQP